MKQRIVFIERNGAITYLTEAGGRTPQRDNSREIYPRAQAAVFETTVAKLFAAELRKGYPNTTIVVET